MKYMNPTDDFVCAGLVRHDGLNLILPVRKGRSRHSYGSGPFAKLKMPPVPDKPGIYLLVLDDEIVYVGCTRGSLRNRLGPRGYATISEYNTLAPQPGKKNGGQQTNCRINTLANAALKAGREIAIWYRVTIPDAAKHAESKWMTSFGVPLWNQRDERV
jgi:hypothetical protein